MVECSAISNQPMTNFIQIIAPYRHAGTWVFDDARVGLDREPFVSGIPEMIDTLVAAIPHAAGGFRLLFSAAPFPGFEVELVRTQSESGGTWYRWPGKQTEGWLCPALFKYFAEAPEKLYVLAEPLSRS
jgi:hypothetical protein